MKRIKQIIIITSMLTAFASFSQENQLYTKEIIPISPEKTAINATVKNHNATNITIGNVVIDKRAAKYYNIGELDEVNEEKAKKINATYITSFEFFDSKNNIDVACIEKIKNNFDLGSYNHQRKINERTIVSVFFEGCSFKISLYSWNEVNLLK